MIKLFYLQNNHKSGTEQKHSWIISCLTVKQMNIFSSSQRYNLAHSNSAVCTQEPEQNKKTVLPVCLIVQHHFSCGFFWLHTFGLIVDRIWANRKIDYHVTFLKTQERNYSNNLYWQLFLLNNNVFKLEDSYCS